MAKAFITRHSHKRGEFAQLVSGETVAALSAHVGDSIDLDFTAGVATSVALESGLYEITIVGADARLKISNAGGVTQASGQYWADGRCDVRFVRQDEKISVVAAA